VSTWIKLHDNLFENPKILAAGDDAALLYIQGLLYCSRNLTDGRIPTPALRMLTARKDARTLARILVREGLWIETATGWEVHEYLLHQRSKATILKEREGTRNRVAAFRERKRNGGGNGPVTKAETETEAETDNPTPTPPPPNCVTHPIIRGETEALVAGAGRPRKTIDPSQVSELRAVRGAVFKSHALPVTSRSERSAPASPLPPAADSNPKGATT
jgi:hypothetical protein